MVLTLHYTGFKPMHKAVCFWHAVRAQLTARSLHVRCLGPTTLLY